MPSFVVFGVWSFQEQKSGLKELTGNSDWNPQEEKQKKMQKFNFLSISVIIHCYRQKYGAIQLQPQGKQWSYEAPFKPLSEPLRILFCSQSDWKG